jgi:hypothetical protein
MTRAVLFAFAFLFPIAAFAAEVKPPTLVDIMTPTAEAKGAEIAAAMPATVDAPIPPLDPARFPVLAKIKEQSGDVAYDYLGQRLGLDLWLVSGPGVMQVIYTLPGNQGAIVGGSLIGADGKELSSDLQQDFITKNPARAEAIIALVKDKKDEQAAPVSASDTTDTPSQKVWKVLEDVGHIGFGPADAAVKLYAVIDPYQKDSRDLWQKLQPMATNGKLRLYTLPLASTNPEHVKVIARLLGEADPAPLLEKLLTDQELPPSDAPANPDGVLVMRNTLEVMKLLRMEKIPVLFYKQADTDKIRVLSGAPKDWTSFEKELGITP